VSEARALLTQLEAQSGDALLLALAWLAGQDVALDEDELKGALRRAELLLAAGGDPHRELDLQGRAVESLAADLADEASLDHLEDALARLTAAAEGLAAVSGGLARLRAQPDLAWRCYAGALLAEALGGD
jgi:hypothetical protein